MKRGSVQLIRVHFCNLANEVVQTIALGIPEGSSLCGHNGIEVRFDAEVSLRSTRHAHMPLFYRVQGAYLLQEPGMTIIIGRPTDQPPLINKFAFAVTRWQAFYTVDVSRLGKALRQQRF